jgi:SnoaL-like protein
MKTMNTKRLLSMLVSLIISGSLLLSACGTVATPTLAPLPTNTLMPVPTSTATEVVIDLTAIAKQFNKAINDGDIEAAMALVADDVSCRGECYFTGKDLFRSLILSSIHNGERVDISDFTVDGDRVTYKWRAYSKAGFLQAAGTESLQIRDGLIILMESVAL